MTRVRILFKPSGSKANLFAADDLRLTWYVTYYPHLFVLDAGYPDPH